MTEHLRIRLATLLLCAAALTVAYAQRGGALTG